VSRLSLKEVPNSSAEPQCEADNRDEIRNYHSSASQRDDTPSQSNFLLAVTQ